MIANSFNNEPNTVFSRVAASQKYNESQIEPMVDRSFYKTFAPIDEFRGMGVDELLEYVSSEQPQSIRNLYDLIDALFLICREKNIPNIKNSHVKEIADIRKSRSWKMIHSSYIECWINRHHLIAEKLSTLYRSELVSDSQNEKVMGKWGKDYKRRWITCREFFTSELTFKFNLTGNNKSFLLNIRPDDPWNKIFAIEILNGGQSPAGIIKPDNIHLEFETGGHMTGVLSWRSGKGEILVNRDDGNIGIGGLWAMPPERKLTLYAYVF